MSKIKITKHVFIDTNVFIKCALEEVKDLNLGVLDNIYDQLNQNKMILILPEVVKQETLRTLRKNIYEFKNMISNEFKRLEIVSGKNNKNKSNLPDKLKGDDKKNILQEILKLKEEISEISNKNSKNINKKIINSEKNVSKELTKIEEKALKILNKIFKHSNTKIVKLNKDLVLAGLKRASLMIPPYSSFVKSEKEHTKNMDCMIFESLMSYFSYFQKVDDLKEIECIVCIDDIDYFKDENKTTLHDEIKNDIPCKSIAYTNPLIMLEKEFEKNYTKEQVKRYADFSEIMSPATRQYNALSEGIIGNTVASVHSINEFPFTDVAHITNLAHKSNNLGLGYFMTEDTKFCPNCGEDLKDILSQRNITYHISDLCIDPVVVNPSIYSKHIICPGCNAQLPVVG